MSDSVEIKSIKQQQELLKEQIELKRIEYEIGEMHAIQTRAVVSQLVLLMVVSLRFLLGQMQPLSGCNYNPLKQ